MKLSAAILCLAGLASQAMAMTVSHKNAAKVLRAARRLDGQEEGEFAYLMKYNLKMVQCAAGQTVVNAENGEYEYSAVVVRLCPSDSCDSDSTTGCGAGYGDYVVGIQTFVNAYFEDQRDNMQWDDDTFKVDEFTECREYEVEKDDDANQVQYFVGPSCTSNGKDIALALFEDETCTTRSATAFEDISNGWTLPYSSGGLVSTQCIGCMEYNDDGAGDLREMCQKTYENAGYKCETNLEYYSYYGKNEQGCELIKELLPVVKKGSGGKVFGWIVFILVIVGVGAYVAWWRKSKFAP